MTEKTPRELLRESLESNARDLEALPAWLRSDTYTESVFSAPSSDQHQDASPVTDPPPKG